jgi:hypothetical protein
MMIFPNKIVATYSELRQMDRIVTICFKMLSQLQENSLGNMILNTKEFQSEYCNRMKQLPIGQIIPLWEIHIEHFMEYLPAILTWGEDQSALNILGTVLRS